MGIGRSRFRMDALAVSAAGLLTFAVVTGLAISGHPVDLARFPGQILYCLLILAAAAIIPCRKPPPEALLARNGFRRLLRGRNPDFERLSGIFYFTLIWSFFSIPWLPLRVACVMGVFFAWPLITVLHDAIQWRALIRATAEYEWNEWKAGR